MTLGYSTHDGQQELRNVELPWTLAVGAAGAGFTPSVKAQFYGFGSITCRILAGDKVIQQQTSSEDTYPTVECKA